MAAAIGIDLGTTHCAMAAVRSGDRPEVLWNREGDLLTPSVVVFQGPGRILVGKTAKHATKDLPGDCVESVKRHLDDPGWSFADSHGGTHSAVEITALILRRLAEDATETLGHRVADAVIAVPAYFDDAGRDATGRAAELAGLNVLRLVDEPAAAGIAFGTSGSGSLLVYDLGGGTFDVTVMNVEGADPRVMATSGDRDLGGLDFDERLMRHVAAEVRKQTGPDLFDGGRRQAELREKCEQARHALSRAFQTRVFFGGGDRSHTVEVSRERFERMTKGLLERTAVGTEEILGEAGLAWAQIDRILLVGGSTRMPMVRRMIERRFGSVPDTSVNPDEAVALGAALLAAQGANRRRGPAAVTPPSAVRSAGREKPRTGTEAHRRRPRAVRRRDGELH
jgi:molecular chaperone DnaK